MIDLQCLRTDTRLCMIPILVTTASSFDQDLLPSSSSVALVRCPAAGMVTPLEVMRLVLPLL